MVDINNDLHFNRISNQFDRTTDGIMVIIFSFIDFEKTAYVRKNVGISIFSLASLDAETILER